MYDFFRFSNVLLHLVEKYGRSYEAFLCRERKFPKYLRKVYSSNSYARSCATCHNKIRVRYLKCVTKVCTEESYIVPIAYISRSKYTIILKYSPFGVTHHIACVSS